MGKKARLAAMERRIMSIVNHAGKLERQSIVQEQKIASLLIVRDVLIDVLQRKCRERTPDDRIIYAVPEYLDDLALQTINATRWRDVQNDVSVTTDCAQTGYPLVHATTGCNADVTHLVPQWLTLPEQNEAWLKNHMMGSVCPRCGRTLRECGVQLSCIDPKER